MPDRARRAALAAAVLLAVAAVWAAAGGTTAGADEVVRYQHLTRDVTLPPGPHTLGQVPSITGRAGYYSWQVAVDSPRPGRCNVWFVRMPARDGTGNLTVMHPAGRWYLTHQHTVSGFSSAMQVRMACTGQAVVRWRILKGVA